MRVLAAWTEGILYVPLGVLIGVLLAAGVLIIRRRMERKTVDRLLLDHFGQVPRHQIEVQSREFPSRVCVDAYRSLLEWMDAHCHVDSAVGLPVSNSFMTTLGLGVLLAPTNEPTYPSALEYDSFDVGTDQPALCVKHALWLLRRERHKLAVAWTSTMSHSRCGFETKLRIDVASVGCDESEALRDALIRHIEQGIQAARAYRGKILSLDGGSDYPGNSGGVVVHRLRRVERGDVILPEATIRLLERNVVRFVGQRSELLKLGMPVKKGLLFYGPPGTGKTHTIHYLLGALEGHTTLLITGDQVGLLEEYMALARLLQPSIVVIEDADLIGREREGAAIGRESLLNRLLNEMDGLRGDAEILFLLTTNRPESLEKALAARPGRIDQAIEFPLPDEVGRRKLIRLYAAGAEMTNEVVERVARVTQGVSASFIKELMRRAIQFHLECSARTGQRRILQNDVDQAIDELLFVGGSLNRSLLGAESAGE